MKQTMNVWDMKKAFEEMDRDYYSMNGIDALLDFYDEINPDMEFDAVAICCDCTEYGSHGAACTLDDMVNDYGYLYSKADYIADYNIDDDENSDDFIDGYIDALVYVLDGNTTVLRVSNGNYIVFSF